MFESLLITKWVTDLVNWSSYLFPCFSKDLWSNLLSLIQQLSNWLSVQWFGKIWEIPLLLRLIFFYYGQFTECWLTFGVRRHKLALFASICDMSIVLMNVVFWIIFSWLYLNNLCFFNGRFHSLEFVCWFLSLVWLSQSIYKTLF